MVYRTSPSLKDRIHSLNTSDIYLDNAAQEVLGAFKKLYNPDELEILKLFFDQHIRSQQTTLPHFNKLMTHVLLDHLNSLPIEDQIRFKYKILNQENSSISTLRDKTSLHLRFLLWKVQAVIGKISFVINNSLPAALIFGSCLGAVLIFGINRVTTLVQKYLYDLYVERCALFIFNNVQIPIFKKCVSIFKLTLENSQTAFIFKNMYILSLVMLAIMPIIVLLPVVFVISSRFTQTALFLVNLWQVTMSPAAILTKKINLLTDDFNHLSEKWHELCINPQLLKA
jgi:hypothetical protein